MKEPFLKIASLIQLNEMLTLLFIVFNLYLWLPAASVDFLFNSFAPNQVVLIGDATVDSSTIKLTKNDEDFSSGRFLYPNPVTAPNNMTPSFSTSFVFSILPESNSTRGFGLGFAISTFAIPSENLIGQYFGFLSNTTTVAPIILVEFDTGQDPEFNDINGNHVGIDLNNPESVVSSEAGYYNSSNDDEFVPVDLRSGKNIQAWIEFDGKGPGINVTVAPVGIPKPSKPLISFYNTVIAEYASSSIVPGFSAGHTGWGETERILAWSLSDKGAPRQINTSDLPTILQESSSSSSSSISSGRIIGIVFISVAVLLVPLSGLYWFKFRKRGSKRDEGEVESWELEYWPHRFSYEELARATNRFSDEQLLGRGGFGKVFKGKEANNGSIAVKSINRDSKQGFREFMTEISTIGRLQHKNLVPLRGWCKEGQEMLLVYDYMPNGNLYSWIFSESRTLNWQRRLLVLKDIAEGLNYLHHGWLQLVLHRDIKSSNILLDSDMCARLGDFGLAKLYNHGQETNTTRLVGTIGYMAPELVKAGPTMASDIYSFGVVVLEVACGRKPTELLSEYDLTLVDWVKRLQIDGRLNEAPDSSIAGEYEAEDMEKVLKLGLACCDVVPEMRPDMKEVLTLLMNLKPIYSSELQRMDGFDLGNLSSTVSLLHVISDYGPRT